jgi:preprotein translocase subunit SecG
MVTTLIVFQVFICISLVILVLLQFGKGAEMGAVMGQGSSQAIFSSSQGGNIMTKATTVCAILFMVNSVSLSMLKSREAKKSIMDNVAPVAMPLNNDAAKANTEAAPASTTSAQTTNTTTSATATTSDKPSSAPVSAPAQSTKPTEVKAVAPTTKTEAPKTK